MADPERRREAQLALRRFGLGARPGEVERLGTHAREAVLASLSNSAAVRLDDADLDPSNVALANIQMAQRKRQEERAAAKPAIMSPIEMAPPVMSGTPPQPPSDMQAQTGAAGKSSQGQERLTKVGPIRREAYQDEAAARFERLVTTNTGFLERLVLFWSNHFCVSAAKGNVRALAGAYEREVVRPHVLGRFVDMLLASAQHPAMLIYLDNQLSIGPNSTAGLNRKRGLNENLAREILELHTLGVDGGYVQDDVGNLARLLTGWTVGGLPQGENAGKFFYAKQRREPGTWQLAGKRYDNLGVEAGQRALRDLALHPSTARHVARKFAAHFVSSPPPPALVAKLEASFKSTDGDLAALARTLLMAEESWAPVAQKMLPPNDFLVATVRGMPFRQRPRSPEIVRLSNQLGQPLWAVPSPKGWPEENDAWAGPSALRERLRIAEFAAIRLDRAVDPRALADDILGGVISPKTREAIARAETKEQGFQLLLMSPEFQRR